MKQRHIFVVFVILQSLLGCSQTFHTIDLRPISVKIVGNDTVYSWNSDQANEMAVRLYDREHLDTLYNNCRDHVSELEKKQLSSDSMHSVCIQTLVLQNQIIAKYDTVTTNDTVVIEGLSKESNMPKWKGFSWDNPILRWLERFGLVFLGGMIAK